MDYTIVLKNLRRYPVRVLVGRDSDGAGRYQVIRQYGTWGPITVDEAVLTILRMSPNVRIEVASTKNF